MAIATTVTQEPRHAPGEFLLVAAAALRAHIESSRLGPHVTANVVKALCSDGRLLESEDSAALACLTLLSYESASGGDSPEHAIPASIAMECLMAAGDVLDDIQDDELDVNGWESSATAAETVAALLVLAHAALAVPTESVRPGRQLDALGRFTTFEARALGGQSNDVRMTADGLSYSDVLNITRAKSGSLGRCAAELGAALATGDEQLIRMHGDFGEHVAVVFQLMNDIADVWPGEKAGSDLLVGRPTPLVRFAQHTASGRPSSVRTPWHSSVSTENAVRAGAVQFVWALATAELAQARRKAHAIETLTPVSRLSLLLHH